MYNVNVVASHRCAYTEENVANHGNVCASNSFQSCGFHRNVVHWVALLKLTHSHSTHTWGSITKDPKADLCTVSG